MNTNSHSTPKPAATGGVPLHLPTPGTAFDLVPGEPPVPITIWRTARTGHDAPGVLGARLAGSIVAAYSQPGDTVVDLTDTHVLTDVCAAGRRRHHRGWFTDVSSLIVGPVTTHTPPDPGPDSAEADTDTDGDSDSDSADVADAAGWFGNDLTDTPQPTQAEPGAGTSIEGRTSLIVAQWPLDSSGAAANRVRLAYLLATCHRLLRPDGCLVLVVTRHGSGHGTEDYTPVVSAAASVGLGYLQHIVAVDAGTDSSMFTYYATTADLRDLAGAATWKVHMRVHNDLLVFIAERLGDDGGDNHG